MLGVYGPDYIIMIEMMPEIMSFRMTVGSAELFI